MRDTELEHQHPPMNTLDHAPTGALVSLPMRSLTRRLSSYFWWSTTQLPVPVGPGLWQFTDRRGTPRKRWLLLSLPGTLASWLAWAVRGFTGYPALELILIVLTGIAAVAPIVLWIRWAGMPVPIVLDTRHLQITVLDEASSDVRFNDARLTPCITVPPSNSAGRDRYSVVLSASGYFLLLFASPSRLLRDSYLRSLPKDIQQLPNEPFGCVTVKL